MACEKLYASLACAQTGVAFTAQSLEPNATVVHLQRGHAQQLPVLSANQWFYATLTDSCSSACETVRVIAVDTVADTVTVERTGGVCYGAVTRLSYVVCIPDAIRAIAREVFPAVQSPLVFDCDTYTLRIDCEALKAMVASPCGS